MARLNVDDNREAASKYQVTGLPSLQLFPRGYKKRGLHFRGTELTPANVISFVKSPQVYLVEAAVTDMREWDCVLWLVRLFGYLVIWLFGYLVISVCVRAIRGLTSKPFVYNFHRRAAVF